MTAAGVRHWLSSLLLSEEYEAFFLAAGYDTLVKCEHLNDAILEQIGIKLPGHRRRILSHLPGTAPEPSMAADSSDDDDREVYDIPPIVRKNAQKPVPEEDYMYMNIMEMNEIPKPALPPKKRLSSSEELEARLGIISPPVKPRHSQGIFDTGSHFAKPKGVVYPEKRPPVPTQQVSVDRKLSLLTAENQLNNNIEGFEPGLWQQAPVDATVSLVAKPHAVMKHQQSLTEGVDSRSDMFPIIGRQFSEPCVTAVTRVGDDTAHHSELVDPAPKQSQPVDTGSADAVLRARKFNSGLEHELEELVKSLLDKVGSDSGSAIETAGRNETSKPTVKTSVPSLGTSISTRSAIPQPPDSAIPVCLVSTDSESCGSMVMSEESPVSCMTFVEPSNLFHLETDVKQHSSGKTKPADVECVYVDTNENPEEDLLSWLSLPHNHEMTVQNLEPVTSTDRAKRSVECEYEDLDETNSHQLDADQRDSSEGRYPSPAFPPPPLPTDFQSLFPTFPWPGADNQAPSSDTGGSSMFGFADFDQERAKQSELVKPQPPPRQRRSAANIVNDAGLSSDVTGFSDALDSYLTQKVTSPSVWLSQAPERLICDVSDLEFVPFAEPNEERALIEYSSDAEVVDEASVSEKTKSFHDDAQNIVKPLTADDFQEVPCSKGTGHILIYSYSVFKIASTVICLLIIKNHVLMLPVRECGLVSKWLGRWT